MKMVVALALLLCATACVNLTSQVHSYAEVSVPQGASFGNAKDRQSTKIGGGGQTSASGGGAQTSRHEQNNELSRAPAGPHGPSASASQHVGGAPNAGKSTGSAGPQYDITGRMVADGSVPSISNPSPGQIVGALTSMVPGGILNSAGDAVDAIGSGQAPRSYRGGFVGDALDSALGTTPGAEDGTASSRVASSTNSRGDVLQQQPTLAGTRAIVGDPVDAGGGGDAATGGIGGDYSDVALQDVPLAMRKKNPLAGTSLLTSGMV